MQNTSSIYRTRGTRNYAAAVFCHTRLKQLLGAPPRGSINTAWVRSCVVVGVWLSCLVCGRAVVVGTAGDVR